MSRQIEYELRTGTQGEGDDRPDKGSCRRVTTQVGTLHSVTFYLSIKSNATMWGIEYEILGHLNLSRIIVYIRVYTVHSPTFSLGSLPASSDTSTSVRSSHRNPKSGTEKASLV